MGDTLKSTNTQLGIFVLHITILVSNSYMMSFILINMGAWDRSDVVEIETWCQGDGRIGTRRDWIIKDCATGQVIGRATR
jgi:hypothetical protein